MRNPDRITIALEVIRDEWEAHPDLRLGQLLVNILELKTVDELFNLEDKTLVTRIAERPCRRDRVMDRLRLR